MHARAIGEAGGKLVAIVDVRREAAERLASEYSARAFTSLKEALGEVDMDAVVVAVPPQHLASVAREAIEHGLHVLVEKPVAMDSGSARSLAVLAEKHGVVAMAGYLLRFHPVTIRLGEMLSAGEPRLLDFYHVVPRPPSARSWPIDLDLAVHDIDLALHLLGGGDASILGARLEERSEGSTYFLILRVYNSLVRIYVSDDVAEGLKFRSVRVVEDSVIIDAFHDEYRLFVRTPSGAREEVVEERKPLTIEHEVFYTMVCRRLGFEAKHPLEGRAATLWDAERVLRLVEEARKLLG